MMRRRKAEGVNTPLSSASKYFVISVISKSLFLLMFPTCKGKGVPASSMELKGDKRRSAEQKCVLYFPSAAYPCALAAEPEQRAVPCSVCNRCLQLYER